MPHSKIVAPAQWNWTCAFPLSRSCRLVQLFSAIVCVLEFFLWNKLSASNTVTSELISDSLSWLPFVLGKCPLQKPIAAFSLRLFCENTSTTSPSWEKSLLRYSCAPLIFTVTEWSKSLSPYPWFSRLYPWRDLSPNSLPKRQIVWYRTFLSRWLKLNQWIGDVYTFLIEP